MSVTEPTVFGAAYSVYVRTVRLTLAEKRVKYRLEEIDVFAPGGAPRDYLEHHHPFGRIPAFEHDGFRLYETGAITRYVDAAFAGPRLQPADPRACARMNQIIGVLDSYAYRTLVWDIFVERVRASAQGRQPDEARIAAALPKAEMLHAAPMLIYFRMAKEGAARLRRAPALDTWLTALDRRPSIRATRSPLEPPS